MALGYCMHYFNAVYNEFACAQNQCRTTALFVLFVVFFGLNCEELICSGWVCHPACGHIQQVPATHQGLSGSHQSQGCPGNEAEVMLISVLRIRIRAVLFRIWIRMGKNADPDRIQEQGSWSKLTNKLEFEPFGKAFERALIMFYDYCIFYYRHNF